MCKLSLIMITKGAGAEGARPLCGGARRPPSIISDSLHIPRLEKLTAGYFRPTVGIFSLSAVLQSAPATSLRLLFRLFFGYLPRRRLRLFFCYLWAISGFLWNSMAVVGSGHHKVMIFTTTCHDSLRGRPWTAGPWLPAGCSRGRGRGGRPGSTW